MVETIFYEYYPKVIYWGKCWVHFCVRSKNGLKMVLKKQSLATSSKKIIIHSTWCILCNTHFQTGLRPFSDRFQMIDFRKNGLKNGLNVSDRFKTERKSSMNIYPFMTNKAKQHHKAEKLYINRVTNGAWDICSHERKRGEGEQWSRAWDHCIPGCEYNFIA